MSVPQSTQTTTPLKLVLLDDSLTARYVLTALVKEAVEKIAGRPLQIYTSADGVQGLGYIFIIDPELVILDASLPKYSGRELVDFLATNPKFADFKRRIVILQTKHDDLVLPSNYTVLEKGSNTFLEDLIKAILTHINPALSSYQQPRSPKRWFGKLSIRCANVSERFIDIARKLPKLVRLPFYVAWLFMQIVTSVPLTIFKVLAGDFANTNIDQQNRDLLQFRIQHYPSALTFLTALVIIMAQFVAFVGGSIAVLNRFNQPAYAAWFDNSWSYRKSLTITGTAAGAQTDYVMQVIVNYGSGTDSGKNVYCQSHCKTDFGDVRFTSSDETTQLNYFLEQKTDSTKAMFWVKVPSIPASPSTATIYMYYGNGSASTSSDPENTFLQFEGFESTFDFDTGAASITQEAGGVSGSYHGKSNNAESLVVSYQNDTQYAVDNHFFEGWVRYPTNSAGNANLAGGLLFAGTGSGNGGYQLFVDGRGSPGNQNLTNPFIREDASATGQNTGSTTTTHNTWYFLRAYRNGTTISGEIYNDLYGSPLSTTSRTSESTYSTGYTGVLAYSNNNANYDNFRVRKKANPEPTYTSWGTELPQNASTTVSANGSQTSTVNIPDTDNYLGGKFVITPNFSTNITSIKIREQGSVNGQTGLSNIKLRYELDTSNPYDCSSESFAGSETQFGSTDTDGFDGANGSSTFTGSVSVSTTATMCVYVVADVTSSAGNSQTIEIDIANPSTDVVAASGTVTPGTAVAISGSTTIQATPWYNTSWLKRKRIVIQESQVAGSSDHTNFPALISLTSDTDLSAFAQADGDDILFTSSNGTTKLDHEIETYSSGTLNAWVEIPTLGATTNTVIYIYYGNSAASSQQNRTGVWTNYKGVFHLNENPAASAPQIVDSTSNANNLTSGGSMTSGDSVAGKIGNALDFDGNDQLSVSDPANGSLDVTTEDFTIQTWLKTTSTSSMHWIGKGANGGAGWREYLNGSISSRPGVRLQGTGNIDNTPGSYSHSLTNGSWHLLTTTFTRAGSAAFYIDGTSVVTLSISALNGQSFANADTFYIGRYAGGQFWTGQLDEARIYTGVLSADRISTEYNNYNTPASFISVGSAEPQTDIGDVQVTTTGSQTATIDFPTEGTYIGGAFALWDISGSRNVTSIKITEQGTVNASSYLKNIKLFYESDTTAPYDCASVSYGGTESQFGSTDADGFDATNGSSTFTGSVGITTTSAMCVYPVMDILSGAGDSSTLEIQISNPSTDIVISAGTISATSAVAISGTSTLNDATAPWYNNSWAYRKRIVIQDSQVAGSSALTNFPVLINLTTDSDLASNAQDDSDDILFTSADGTTKLDHEIEKFDGSNGELVAWARIPSLAATSNTAIFMYYGNSSASSQQSVDATWSSEYVGVWHLAQDPSVSAPQIRNSADNTLDGTTEGSMTSGDLVASKIGLGLDFKGTDDAISMGDKASLDMGTGDFTMQSWIRIPTLTGAVSKVPLFAKGAWATHAGYRFEVDQTNGKISFKMETTEAVPGSYSSLADDVWHQASVVIDRHVTATIYTDGVQRGTQDISGSTGDITNSDNFYIGRNNGGFNWAMKFDEVRIRTGTLSSDWIATEYNNQNSPTTFISLASQEAINVAPSVSSVSLNSGANISLTEATTTSVSWTATITDSNGYADISSASGRLYRSGVSGAQACSADTNNCYHVASCSLTSCSGNSCTATCTANVQFHAEPTDTGTYSAEYWRAYVSATDASAATGNGFSATNVNELNTLIASSVTSNINYGTILPGNNTGTENETIVVTNTGNVIIDVEVSGTALCPDQPTCAGDTIPVGNQKYGLSAFTYASGGTALTGTGALLQLNVAKPTQAPSNQTGTIYWGIGVPESLAPGTYTGTNQIIGVADQ